MSQRLIDDYIAYHSSGINSNLAGISENSINQAFDDMVKIKDASDADKIQILEGILANIIKEERKDDFIARVIKYFRENSLNEVIVEHFKELQAKRHLNTDAAELTDELSNNEELTEDNLDQEELTEESKEKVDSSDAASGSDGADTADSVGENDDLVNEGPAITAYKAELEALKTELAENEKENDEVSPDGLIQNIDNQLTELDLEKIANLEQELEVLNEKYAIALQQSVQGVMMPGEKPEEIAKQVVAKREEIEALKAKNPNLKTGNSKDLMGLKTNIKEHENNISLYYSILNDIDTLDKMLSSENRDIQKETGLLGGIYKDVKKLPEPLGQELTTNLEKTLAKYKKDENLKDKGNNDEEVMPIDKIEDKPEITWKTIAMLGAGLVTGAVIGFVAPTGIVGITGVALGIIKLIIKKLRNKAKNERLAGLKKVEIVEEPTSKLQANIQKLKKYIKSEEGLRDIDWMINGALIGLFVSKASKEWNIKQNAAKLNTSNPTNYEAPAQVQEGPSYGDIKIGENVNDFNVTQGHDTASWAVKGQNTENLIQEYVNSDSVFQKFGIIGQDGSVQTSNQVGTSVEDLINAGVPKENIAVLVGKNGVGQGWTSLSELTDGLEVVSKAARSI